MVEVGTFLFFWLQVVVLHPNPVSAKTLRGQRVSSRPLSDLSFRVYKV